MIENAAAVKPAGWGDDSPVEIPDPEALRPDDWDDEEVSGSRSERTKMGGSGVRVGV